MKSKSTALLEQLTALGSIIILAFALQAGLASTGGSPRGVGPTPPGRYGQGMAYDAVHRVVVMFGGVGSSGALADTWIWDGTIWTDAHPTNAPSARLGMGMTFDRARGQVVLFGGTDLSANKFGDMWTWDGTNWTEQHPATSPAARSSMAMTYDAAREQVVLFSGYSDRGLTDTWTWDGTTWTEQHPTTRPPWRNDAGMTYHPDTKQVLMVGGRAVCEELSCVTRNDMWAWDGTAWSRLGPPQLPTPARCCMGMADDSTRAHVVLFGGVTSNFGGLGDTWTYDGTTWTKRRPSTSPSTRAYTNMVFDQAIGEVVMFGGTGTSYYLDDTWTWDGRTWTRH